MALIDINGVKTKPFQIILLHESDLLCIDSHQEFSNQMVFALVKRDTNIQTSLISANRLAASKDKYDSSIGTLDHLREQELNVLLKRIPEVVRMLGADSPRVRLFGVDESEEDVLQQARAE